MRVSAKAAQLILSGGLAGATLGMALVVLGVVVPALFFVGVYLLALGLLSAAAGAVVHVARPDRA